MLVGLWQWMVLVPVIRWARRQNRHAVAGGLLRGGISFSVLQVSVWIVLFFLFRHVSLQ